MGPVASRVTHKEGSLYCSLSSAVAGMNSAKQRKWRSALDLVSDRTSATILFLVFRVLSKSERKEGFHVPCISILEHMEVPTVTFHRYGCDSSAYHITTLYLCF